MSRTPRPADGPPPSGPAPARDAAPGRAPGSVLDRVLAGPGQPGVGLGEATVAAWGGFDGSLADGRKARVAASCLLRPAAGDRVLVWQAAGRDEEAWVLGILERHAAGGEAVLSTPDALAIEAPQVGISARTVSIAARDFVTSTRNRHAVEHTRTENVRLRVAQLGTDVRRAEAAQDEINGTFLQRAGTWVSTTVRDARLRARTFLFD